MLNELRAARRPATTIGDTVVVGRLSVELETEEAAFGAGYAQWARRCGRAFSNPLPTSD